MARLSLVPRGRLAAALPLALLGASLVVAACATATGSDAVSAAPATSGPATTSSVASGTVRLYTSVTQDTVDAVLAAYRKVNPSVSVELFRAPTGQLDARMASEQRQGQIGADILWGTDPLSMEAWAAKGVFAAWTPLEAAAVPAAYHTDTFWGTRILNMVIVYRPTLPTAPHDWADLIDPARSGRVAIPDPGFAGSAFGALGYFASTSGLGMDFYRSLKQAGATQVQGIPDVVTGVAEGQFDAGITLDKTARDAIAKGSPIKIAWPASGAIAIYSPIAILRGARNRTAAEELANFVLTRAGQQAIAGTGWQPIRSDVSGGPPIDGKQVSPDWAAIFDREEQLLSDYRAIFGG